MTIFDWLLGQNAFVLAALFFICIIAGGILLHMFLNGGKTPNVNIMEWDSQPGSDLFSTSFDFDPQYAITLIVVFLIFVLLWFVVSAGK